MSEKMSISKKNEIKAKEVEFGGKIFELIKILYPICRSITGDGVRKTLNFLQKEIPLDINEIATKTKCFDWKIPKEWNITDAYIKDSNGNKIVDFKNSNLHVVSYSIPINKKMSLTELKSHIHTLPDMPDAIPYLTSYYNEDWGFCMRHNEFETLQEGEYEVCINSSLKNGSLTYGEYLIPGKIKDEILLSCYICHPSLCNDNLSGVGLLTILAKILTKISTYYSYRFLFIPETIGAIAWLSKNEKNVHNIKHGLVVTCCGDRGTSTYKKTRDGDNIIDKIVEKVLKKSGEPYEILDFWPSGSDERQFCSPGFNLPIGSLMKTVYGKFEEYHTSKDNLDFMDVESLGNSLSKYLEVIYELENYTNKNKISNQKTLKISVKNDPVFINQNMKCEPQLGKRGLYRNLGSQKPQLGKRGLYRNLGSQKNIEQKIIAIQWIMNFSDGYYSLSEISKKSKINLKILTAVVNLLKDVNLLKEQ